MLIVKHHRFTGISLISSDVQTLTDNATGAFANFLAKQVFLVKGVNISQFAEPFGSAVDTTDTLAFIMIGRNTLVKVDFGVNHVDVATYDGQFSNGALGLIDGFPSGLFFILH